MKLTAKIMVALDNPDPNSFCENTRAWPPMAPKPSPFGACNKMAIIKESPIINSKINNAVFTINTPIFISSFLMGPIKLHGYQRAIPTIFCLVSIL